METTQNNNEEIARFIKLCTKQNINIERVKKYFRQQDFIVEEEMRQSAYKFPKRADENFDAREDREGK